MYIPLLHKTWQYIYGVSACIHTYIYIYIYVYVYICTSIYICMHAKPRLYLITLLWLFARLGSGVLSLLSLLVWSTLSYRHTYISISIYIYRVLRHAKRKKVGFISVCLCLSKTGVYIQVDIPIGWHAPEDFHSHACMHAIEMFLLSVLACALCVDEIRELATRCDFQWPGCSN